MRPHEALSQYREVIRAAVAGFPLANPRVFGSVVAGCDTDDSDLDLLVDTLPGATLFDLGGLQVELEAALGVPVDVLTPGDLPQRFRDSVVREAMPL